MMTISDDEKTTRVSSLSSSSSVSPLTETDSPTSSPPSSPASSPVTPASSYSSDHDSSSRETHTHHTDHGKDFIQLNDFQGLPVTISANLPSDQQELVIGMINEYMYQVFAYGNAWQIIQHAVEIDQKCLLARILLADYCVANEDMEGAMINLEQARILDKQFHYGMREHMYLRIWSAWMTGKRRALPLMEKLIDRTPADLFAVKKAQLIAFLQSDFGKMLEIVQKVKVATACSTRPYYHGMLAFALEENHFYEKAERAGRLGASIHPSDAWSHHAVAHVLYATGRLNEGLTWLLEHSHHWDHCMSFMYTHSWFHVALFYVDLEEYDKLVETFDNHIWSLNVQSSHPDLSKPVRMQFQYLPPDSILSIMSHDEVFLQMDKSRMEDQFGALNILWKLEMRLTGAGAKLHFTESGAEDVARLPLSSKDFTDRYADIIAHVHWPLRTNLGLWGLVFLRAICRIGDDTRAREVLASMESTIEDMKDARRHDKHVNVYLPMARAIYAITTPGTVNGPETAYALLQPIMTRYLRRTLGTDTTDVRPKHGSQHIEDGPSLPPRFEIYRRHVLQVIGGSGEQRSVLVDLWLEVLYSSGHIPEALHLAQSLIAERNCVPYHHRFVDACLKYNVDRRMSAIPLPS